MHFPAYLLDPGDRHTLLLVRHHPHTKRTSASKAFPIQFTTWLCPHITSRSHQAFAIIAYVTILASELLEGLWVVQTTWRWMDIFFSRFPDYQTTSLWVYAVCMNSAAIVLTFALGVVLVGFAVVILQALCIIELIVSAPLQKLSSEKQELAKAMFLEIAADVEQIKDS